MSTPDPAEFAERWITAWNARDAESVLVDYADEVVFTSPTAARLVPESGGTVRGKHALRRYWTIALEADPDLRFELVRVYAGVDTLVLEHHVVGLQVGGHVAEVLTFRDGLVTVGHATHLRD